MKKFLTLTLFMVFLLAGCAVHDEAEPTTTVETAPPGLYVSTSSVEQQTGGAVRFYALPEQGYRWLSAIGDQLLLASGGEPATLTVLTGADCVPTARLQVDPDLLSDDCSALYNGFAYYDDAENQAIFLDPQLQETNRVAMPDDIQGEPLFSPDGGEIFYCTDKELRSMDVERKLSRLIKSHSYDEMTLLGCHFDCKLLSCRVSDEKDGENTLYISAETGQTLQTENGITALYTYESSYLALRTAGIVDQCIFGTMDGAAQMLRVSEPNLVGALELGGAVGYQAQDGKLDLAFYDLTSGKKTAAVSMEGVGIPQAFLADRWSGCVWVLTTDPESGSNMLLRWDKKISAVEEDAVYLSTLYTSQAPDEAGLDACDDRVSALNKTHGVRIRIWQEAVKYPGNHKMVAEHQSAAINTVLDQLEPVLGEFPKKFLQKSIASRIRICIVRSIDGQIQSAQYWDENDAFIVLSAGVDVRKEFLKGLGYVIDSHVLGNSPMYDHWNELNPAGFVYGEADEKYLTGEDRAFADETSMKSAADDRSRILYEAMQPDNADLFSGATMQKKLLQVCAAIRDAWGLERSEEAYPWEQYLMESIAYKK